MKLFCSPTSPYVRKVLTLAHEIGIQDKIEKVLINPREAPEALTAKNPVGKIPVLIADDGAALHDSVVICSYLDQTFGRGRFSGAGTSSHWKIATAASVADGLTDAVILYRNEILRTDCPQPSAFAEWQLAKVYRALESLDAMVADFRDMDLAQIGFGCGLGWIEFRMPERKFLAKYPAAERWFADISKRPSFVATAPKG